MNKKQFLEELEKNLTGLKKEDIKEILDDYKEHFKVGKKRKRKESEIVSSLGDPKEIATEAKKELGEENTLKKDWNIFKKIIKQSFKGFYFYLKKNLKNNKQNKVKKTKKKQKNNKTKKSFWKIFGIFWLNFLVMIWILLSLYIVIFNFFIAGGTIILSGLASFVTSIFILISKSSLILNKLALSGIFASIGIMALGALCIIWTSKLTKATSFLIKKYYNWNKKVIRK